MTSAHDRIDDIMAARRSAGRLLLGLDFDGTLAPIVPTPDEAALPAATRSVLERVAGRADTAVAFVSGRSLQDLRQRADVDGAFYAGNHGLEIDGPGVHRVHPDAEAALPAVRAVRDALRNALGNTPGVLVEDKGLTLSVHYRLVEDPAVQQHVVRTFETCTAGVPGIRTTRGKRVLEVRPDVDWHKGRALQFLRDTLGAADAPALFIGDDVTDEDAFRIMGPGDTAVYVGDSPPADTAASARLTSPEDVAAFLGRLA